MTAINSGVTVPCLILLTNFENVCKNQLLRHVTGTFEEMMTVLGKIGAYNNKLSTLELLTLDFPSYKQIFLKNILKIPIKSRIFAALESATLPIEQRTRAELFVYMRMEYTNPPLDTATLLANLQNEHHGKSVVKHKLKIDTKCHFSIHIAFA